MERISKLSYWARVELLKTGKNPISNFMARIGW